MHFHLSQFMVVVIDPQIAGISGDMLLSALVDLGADKSKIVNGIRVAEKYLLGSTIKNISFGNVNKHGISATELILDLVEDTKERHGTEIKQCIEKSINEIGLSEKAKKFAITSIEVLMHAESKVHNAPLESVHFHEASSMDTVVDIVGAAIALDDLHFLDDEIISTPVAVGGGTVTFSHGTTSNPASAILEIFRNSEFIISGGQVKEELTTPTGACMLASLTKSCSEFYPSMTISSIGYGSGKNNFDGFSNVLKIVQGKKVENIYRDSVKVLETNLDDVSGEVLGIMIEKIMDCGAKDVTVSPAITKKGRPTNLVSVICDSESMNSILELLISETGTLGVRIRTSERFVVPRTIITSSLEINGKSFDIRYKTNVKNYNNFKIEADDIAFVANTLKIPFIQSEELIKTAIKQKINKK